MALLAVFACLRGSSFVYVVIRKEATEAFRYGQGRRLQVFPLLHRDSSKGRKNRQSGAGWCRAIGGKFLLLPHLLCLSLVLSIM